ncbi:SOS response-associated peptidase, partial [bacterium]|nr:SOS response-associated peptidase [bacterium]
KPRYNVAPTDAHWIVRESEGARRLSGAAWGLRKGGGPLAINVRSENVGRGAFKTAFRERRCLVPADGFFEWTGKPKARKPIWFHRSKGGLLLLAGLYEEEKPGKLGFTILTAAANELIAPVHDRMPLMLSEERARAWLEEASLELLRPADAGPLVATAVSPRVNSVKNDDPGCLAPETQEKGRSGQLPLF